jgi:hypothetical protein
MADDVAEILFDNLFDLLVVPLPVTLCAPVQVPGVCAE